MELSTVEPACFYSSLAQDADLGELVELFVTEIPAKMAAIVAAAEARDWPRLRTLGHQLKGSAGSYGFGQLTPYAQVLETAASREPPEIAIFEAVERLLAACQRVRGGSPTA